MNNHLIFCCSHPCLLSYMKGVKKVLGEKAAVNSTSHEIISGDNRFLFFTNINDFPEKIHGLSFVGFEVCSSYDLSDKVLAYIVSHITREEQPVGNLRPGL